MDQTQSPSSVGEIVMCACGGKEYNARDVIDAALFRCELASIWKEFLIGVEADERATELNLEPDYDAVDAAAEAFRYNHDLITAEETEQWLDARSLSLEDFTGYCTRQYWRSATKEKIEPDDIDLVSASPELRNLFTAGLVFSGQLSRLNTHLTWRLAALSTIGQTNLECERTGAERKAFLERTQVKESKLKGWLGQLARDEKWLDEMVRLEAAYQKLREQVLTPQQRQKQLTSLRMPLTQFEAEVIELESGEAAKEALLCIRQDGMSMEEVAAEARYPYRRITFLHKAVPEELKQKFWSASAGDVLDPLPRGEGFELYRITRKIEPNPTDPEIQDRIDEHLLEKQFAALTSEHVDTRLDDPALSE
jgi:hypothetical protein